VAAAVGLDRFGIATGSHGAERDDRACAVARVGAHDPSHVVETRESYPFDVVLHPDVPGDDVR
jgi:hypothetical protein